MNSPNLSGVNSVTLRRLLLIPAVLVAAPNRPLALASVDPDGIRTLLANPAGLALVDGQEASLQLGGNQKAGQDALLLGVPHFGIGWEQHPVGDLSTKESNLVLGTGASWGGHFSWGALATRHVVEDVVQGWSADLGLLWRPISQISLAWVCPDILNRDDSRDRTNTLGLGFRPLGTPELSLSVEAFLAGTPWKNTSWSDPTWELGAKIRPLDWLALEGRFDPQHAKSYGFGLQIQATPNVGFFSTATPNPAGPEFQSAGIHYASRSRQSVEVGDGVLVYRVAQSASESPSQRWLRTTPGFQKVRDDFREMESIRELKTVVLDLGSTRFSPVQAGILRRMILDLKRSGKTVYAWTNDLDMASLHILSAADKAAMSPDGTVRTRGLAMDVLYFGGLLKQHGIAVQVVKTGPWKAAMEPFEKTSMSSQARDNMSRHLFDLDSMILGGVAMDRKLDPAALVAFVDTGSALPKAARSQRLVDTLLDHDHLSKWAKGRILSLPLGGIHNESWGQSPRVAVVVLEGQITDKPGEMGMIPWNSSLVAETVSARLDALSKDPRVGGVVLRIQSPGGSVTGSERLRRAVERLAQAKPVVASFGSMAASGGYMMALPASKIFTEPEAMVGSIGVFAAQISIGGLLDSFGIRAERIRTAPHAGAMSPYHPLDSLELGRMTEFVEDAHLKFCSEVMNARHLDTLAFHKVDGGRIFSGARAVDLGLADSTGGLDDAVRWTQSKAGLGANQTVIWFDGQSGEETLDDAAALMAASQASEQARMCGWKNYLESSRTTIWSQTVWEPQWE